MNLIPWKDKRRRSESQPVPVPFVDRFRQEMDQLFDRVFQSPLGLDWPEVGWAVQPSIDVTDSTEEVVVRAELPGIDPKELELTLSGDILTIAGKKEEHEEHRDKNLYFSDRRYGSFRRSIQLPCKVDRENIAAESRGGILEVKLRKLESERPRKIQITAK